MSNYFLSVILTFLLKRDGFQIIRNPLPNTALFGEIKEKRGVSKNESAIGWQAEKSFIGGIRNLNFPLP